MSDTPDILRDFSALQADIARLSQTNVELANVLMTVKQERDEAQDKLEVMTAKAVGWQNQAELNARLLVECREKAERYRLEANAMMAQRDEAREALQRITECDMRRSKFIARTAMLR